MAVVFKHLHVLIVNEKEISPRGLDGDMNEGSSVWMSRRTSAAFALLMKEPSGD